MRHARASAFEALSPDGVDRNKYRRPPIAFRGIGNHTHLTGGEKTAAKELEEDLVLELDLGANAWVFME